MIFPVTFGRSFVCPEEYLFILLLYLGLVLFHHLLLIHPYPVRLLRRGPHAGHCHLYLYSRVDYVVGP